MKDKDELYEEAEQLRKRELTAELALLANWLQCSIGGRIAEARKSLRDALRHHFRRQAAEDARDRMKHEPYVLTCETVLRRAEIVSREFQMESAWKLLQRHVPDELNGTSEHEFLNDARPITHEICDDFEHELARMEYAKKRGYFWLPCARCGKMFSGHEWKGSKSKQSVQCQIDPEVRHGTCCVGHGDDAAICKRVHTQRELERNPVEGPWVLTAQIGGTGGGGGAAAPRGGIKSGEPVYVEKDGERHLLGYAVTHDLAKAAPALVELVVGQADGGSIVACSKEWVALGTAIHRPADAPVNKQYPVGTTVFTGPLPDWNEWLVDDVTRQNKVLVGSMIYQCGKCGYMTAYQSEHECVPLLGTITTGSETVKAK